MNSWQGIVRVASFQGSSVRYSVQVADKELDVVASQDAAERFAALADALTNNEDVIVAELNEAQGTPADIGGYYYPDREKTTAVMRPSKTFNAALAAAQG